MRRPSQNKPDRFPEALPCAPEGEITAPGLQPVGEAMGALQRILPKLPLEKFVSGLPR